MNKVGLLVLGENSQRQKCLGASQQLQKHHQWPGSQREFGTDMGTHVAE